MEDFGYDLAERKLSRVGMEEPIYEHAIESMGLYPSMARHLAARGWSVFALPCNHGDVRKFEMRNGTMRAYYDDHAWHGPNRTKLKKDMHSYHCDGHECEEPHHHIISEPPRSAQPQRDARVIADTLAEGGSVEAAMQAAIIRPEIIIEPKRDTGDEMKKDDDKPRFELLPPEPLFALAALYAQGAKKYRDRGWEEGMSWGRIFGALCRHAWKFWRGEDFDQETGAHHMVAVMWNAAALYTYAVRKIGTDDRSKS